MKSIDTFYNGNFFRSRLEARWAAFFDYLGVKYEYEPEGFKSENGECYLPDFYLPDTYLRGRDGKGVYIEIKPISYDNNTIPAAEWFDRNLVLFKGFPAEHNWMTVIEDGFQLYPFWDNYMTFWICKNCNTSKIEFAESSYDSCPICGSKVNYQILEDAGLHASKIRFEHNN